MIDFVHYRSHQTQLASLSIEHILSGYKSIVHRMSEMVLLVVVAVKEWRSVITAPKTCHHLLTYPISLFLSLSVFCLFISDMKLFNQCSQWMPNICCLTMAESCVWSVLTQLSWALMNANLSMLKYKNFMKAYI